MGQQIPNSQETGSVTFWLSRLRGGDLNGAEQLFIRYADQLADRARRRFGGPIDPDDLVQSVFRVLITKADNGTLPPVTDRNDLLPLLFTISAHKAIDKLRRRKPVALPEEIDDPSLSMVTIAESTDQVRYLFEILGDKTLRTIAQRKIEGLTRNLIAKELGVSEKTVSRKLTLIRSIWEREFAAQ
ncbi:MAG: sigma-70 family RNA polymerase sigma factor [Planctomycetota bacterium]